MSRMLLAMVICAVSLMDISIVATIHPTGVPWIIHSVGMAILLIANTLNLFMGRVQS